jgi:TRAP-type C4-dicarboxylate transport system substrate-binding protein
MQISLRSSDHRGSDYDAATIREVKQGRADLGLAASRAWDDFGARGPTALGAPFLVDSYAIQARLFSGDLLDTLLLGLDRAGVVGVGIVPGPIRHPLGLSNPLTSPDLFAGLTIGTQQSSVADATVRALGAHPRRRPREITPEVLQGLDGLEIQTSAIESGRLDLPGSHLITNVELWPRALVLFAGPTAYDALSEGQQRILVTAAKEAAIQKATAEVQLEAETAANLCRKGNTSFDVATPDQLAAFRRAVEPVYAELETDPEARAVVEAVQEVKDEMAQPASDLSPCSPPRDAQGNGEPTDVDGVWTMDSVQKEAPPEFYDENWGHWVFVFWRGRFAITQENRTACTWGYGTYAVNGTRMSWSFLDGGGIAPNDATNRPGEYFVFDFSRFRDTLALQPVKGQISPSNFRVHPWRLLSEDLSSNQLSARCAPPESALAR